MFYEQFQVLKYFSSYNITNKNLDFDKTDSFKAIKQDVVKKFFSLREKRRLQRYFNNAAILCKP
jgi:hypothetical protein